MGIDKNSESFFSKLFKRKTKRDTKDRLAAFLEILKQEENPDLKEDEEERIFFDNETGKWHKKIVKKERTSDHQQTQAPRTYPPDLSMSLKVKDEISFTYEGNECHLSISEKTDDPYGADILVSRCGKQSYDVHADIFFQELLSNKSSYLATIDKELLHKIANSYYLKVNTADDSRSYYDITVNKEEISIPGHGLCLAFYVGNIDNNIYMITEGLFDDERDEMPRVVTRVEGSVLAKTSAKYDDEEEGYILA